MKRVWSVLCVCAMLIGMLPMMTLFASAAYTSDNFVYVVTDGKASITDYSAQSVTLTIPSTLGEYPVTSIGDRAFEDCYTLESVVISSGVTTIGVGAFSDCTSLYSITLPDSVTSIGDDAFVNCESLRTVTIPNAVTSIGDGVFSQCESLTAIAVKSDNAVYCSVNGVLFTKDEETLIHYPAGKTATSYAVPNGVRHIAAEAFYESKSLQSVVLPSGVTDIGNRAFYNCSSIQSITIPNGVTRIEAYTFSYCSSLERITLAPSVTSIAQDAFYYCSSLQNVAIPKKVIDIGQRAFYHCSSLESIAIPQGVTTIADSVFYGCRSLKSVAIAQSVTEIADDAFYQCRVLADVYYAGTQEAWNAISIGDSNDCLTSATLHCNAAGIPIPADTDVIYIIETVQARKMSAGDTFTVDVTVNDIEKLCMVEFKFAYDATAVKAVSSELKGALAAFAMKNINLAPGNTDLGDKNIGEVWITGMDLADVTTKNGDVIATITFEALKDIEEDVSLYSYQEPLAACAPATPLKAAAVNGGLEIVESILGDFDDNDIVNMMDALQVYSLFAAGTYPQEKIALADINDDGSVDMFDCLLLFNIASGVVI